LVVLNDDQVAEIQWQEAFSVCDVIGSGTIERGELAKVIQNLEGTLGIRRRIDGVFGRF
jgi:Ca2+-binding EF-hand superfamily protein